MNSKNTLYFSLLAFILILPNCKKKSWDGTKFEVPITSYVISKSALKVYSAPDLASKVMQSLPSNTEFKILEEKIVNPAFEKISWFKVALENEIGYMSQQVLEKGDISRFKELSSPEEAFIAASSLRIRKNPSLTGEVITSLPLNTKVEIIANGLNSERVDDKYDNWVKIKTSDGKIGFCFRGYLLFNLNPEWAEEALSGFIKIKTANVLELPTGEKFNEQRKNETTNFFFTVAENFIYPVKTKAIIEGKIFYSVNESFSSCDPHCDANGIISFWISEEDVDYFNSNISEFTRQEFGFENEELFKYAIYKFGKNIDVRNIKINPLGENAESISFWNLDVSLDTSYQKSSDSQRTTILQNNNGKYSEIYALDSGTYLFPHDFDKDGISEIGISSGGRMNSKMIYYAIKNKRLVKLIELENGEYYIDDGNSYFSHYEIKEDKIIVEKTQNEKKSLITYVYQNGNFVKEK